MMADDMDLVRDYAVRRSETAFATLVSRHIHLVYSVALRQTRDPHLAVGGTTKGQHPADRSPEAESPTATTALVELPPRDDAKDVISSNDGDDSDGLERDLGLR